MIFYELHIGYEFHGAFTSKRKAVSEGKKWREGRAASVDRIKTVKLSKQMILDMLNEDGFVIDRETIWEVEEDAHA